MNNIKTTLLAALLVTASIANADEEHPKELQALKEAYQETVESMNYMKLEYQTALLKHDQAWHVKTRPTGAKYIRVINKECTLASDQSAEIGVQLNAKGQIDSVYIAARHGSFPHDIERIRISFGGEVYSIGVSRSSTSPTGVLIKDVETFMRLMKDSDLTAVEINLTGQKSIFPTFNTESFLFNRTNK